MWGLQPPSGRQTGKEKRPSSDLQQRVFGRGQKIDGGREFLEELGGHVAQADALDPVHQQVQVGPDLDAPGPLVEASHRACRQQKTQLQFKGNLDALMYY